MAYGFNDTGASLIVGLVQDYRNRADKKARRQEELDYRDEQDIENKRRYEDGRAYQQDRDEAADKQQKFSNGIATNNNNMRVQDFNRAKDLRSRQEKARTLNIENQQAEAGEARVASIAQNDARLQEAQDGVTAAQASEAAMSFGNSGLGQSMELQENSDNTLTPMGVDGQGNMRAFTVNPSDPNSPQMKASKAEMGKLREHVQNGHAGYIEMFGKDADPKNISTFLRSTIYSDKKTGMSRVATPEEQEANLKEQGLLNKPDAPVAPATPVYSDKSQRNSIFGAERQDYGTTDYSAPGAGGTKQMLKDVGTGFAGAANSVKDTVVDNIPLVKLRKDMSEYFEGEHWNGKKGKSPVKVDKDGAIKINARFNMTTDKEQLIQGVKNAKQAGVELKASKENLAIAEKSHSEQMTAINEKFSSKTRANGAAAELYATGLWTEDQFNNYGDTGDMRYSDRDVIGQNQGDVNFGLNVQNVTSQIQKRQADIEKIKGLSGTKKMEAMTKLREKTAASFKEWAGIVAGAQGGKSEYIKQNTNRMVKATVVTRAELNLSLEDLQDPTLQLSHMEAMEAWLRSDGDKVGASYTGFLNSAVGKLRIEAGAEAIGALAMDKGVSSRMSTPQILKQFDHNLLAYVDYSGGSISDDAYKKFVSDFKSEMLKGNIN